MLGRSHVDFERTQCTHALPHGLQSFGLIVLEVENPRSEFWLEIKILLYKPTLGNTKLASELKSNIKQNIFISKNYDSNKELQGRGQQRIRHLRSQIWIKTIYIFRFALIYCMLLSWIMIIIFEIFHFWLGILQNRILQIILTKSRSGGAIIPEIRSMTDALIDGVDAKMVGSLQNIGTFIYVGTSFTACKNLIYF